MKDAYYFRHDSNARFDPKILKLRAKFGMEGYGFFFCLLEIMRDSSDYCINESDLDTLSLQLGLDNDKIIAMLEICYSVGLLVVNNGKVSSTSFIERMDEMNELREKRREAGRKGGKAKAKLKQTCSKPLALKESKVKEKKVKEKKVNNYEQEFNSFYEKYPLKKSKDKAKAKFIQLRKEGTSLEELMSGLTAYLSDIKKKNTEPKFIKHPSTWLNQGCWADEYEKPERQRAYNGLI